MASYVLNVRVDCEYVNSLLPHLERALEENLLTEREAYALLTDELLATVQTETVECQE